MNGTGGGIGQDIAGGMAMLRAAAAEGNHKASWQLAKLAQARDIVMPYVVVSYIVMAYVVMAYIVLVYIVMATTRRHGSWRSLHR